MSLNDGTFRAHTSMSQYLQSSDLGLHQTLILKEIPSKNFKPYGICNHIVIPILVVTCGKCYTSFSTSQLSFGCLPVYTHIYLRSTCLPKRVRVYLSEAINKSSPENSLKHCLISLASVITFIWVFQPDVQNPYGRFWTYGLRIGKWKGYFIRKSSLER